MELIKLFKKINKFLDKPLYKYPEPNSIPYLDIKTWDYEGRKIEKNKDRIYDKDIVISGNRFKIHEYEDFIVIDHNDYKSKDDNRI